MPGGSAMQIPPQWVPMQPCGSLVSFRQANAGQVGDVLTVLDEVAAWLASMGVQQWPHRFDAAWVRSAIEEGHTWLVDADELSVATITLDWSDQIWGPDDGSAGYVHRLAVRRHAAGLGPQLLGWAAEETIRQGRHFLRLDCVATNRRLRSYYESAGFQARGDVEVGGAPGQRIDAGPRILLSRYELDLQLQQEG